MLVKLCQKIFNPKVQYFILAVIIINALTLGLETSTYLMSRIGGLLIFLDGLALSIFVVEILMKIVAQRGRFFLDPWNLFDFAVVSIALAPNSGALAVLRALRILRVLRLITALPRLRIIVEGVFHALPSLGWIFMLLFVIFYVFSVLSTNLFAANFPQWFGSIGATMFTLFQMLTMESWAMGIARPVMEVFPHAYLLFVPFILVTAFIVLNVFIGIIVNTMSNVAEAEKNIAKNKKSQPAEPDLAEEFAKLQEQMNLVERLMRQKLKGDD